MNKSKRRWVWLEERMDIALTEKLAAHGDTFQGVVEAALLSYVSNPVSGARRCGICNRRVLYGQPHLEIGDTLLDSVQCLNQHLSIHTGQPIRINWFDIWGSGGTNLGLHTYSLNRRGEIIIANQYSPHTRRGQSTCRVCGKEVGTDDDVFSGWPLVGKGEHNHSYHLNCTIPDEPQAPFLNWAARVAGVTDTEIKIKNV